MTPIFDPPRRRPFDASAVREDAFVACVSPQDARRQLRVSLGLMGVMAAGALAVLASHGLPRPGPAQPAAARVAVEQPQFVRAVTASRIDPAAARAQ